MKLKLSRQSILNHRRFVVAFILTIAAGWMLTGFLGRVAEKGFKEGVDREANLIASILKDDLGDVENAAKALSQSESMVAALSSGSRADLEGANRVLDRYKSSLEMSVCYLLDRNGLAVASSNRNDKTGFVGRYFATRPYFKGASAGRLTPYFALGNSTSERGYYAAAPVFDGSGAITGVVAIKRNIAPIEKTFRKYPNSFLVSPEGIVFITSREELLFRALWPVDERRHSELLASRQFGNIRFEPLLAAEPRNGTYARFDNSEHYIQRLPFGSDGWSLVFMEEPNVVSGYRLFGILLTIVFVLLLLFFFNVLLYKNKSLEAASELLKSRDDWRRTFDAVPDLIAIIDQNHRIIGINRAMSERLGISRQVAIGRRCHELVHGSQEPPASCPHRKLLDSGRTESETLFEKNLNGDFTVTTAPILAEDGTIESSVHVMHDISDLKRMEQSLKEYAQRLELVLEGSNDATWEWDMISDQGLVNERHYEMTGYSPDEVDVNFEFFIKNIHPDDVFEVQQHATEYVEGNTDKFEARYRMITRSGQIRHVIRRGKVVSRDENGSPLKMAGVITDITEQKRLDDEVNRIHNLESIGLLAGGLAHDFNNVLNIIYGNLTFARMLAGDDSAITESLTDAEEACERARELGIRLQGFSQGSLPVKKPIALSAIIEDTAATLFKGSNILHTLSAANDLLPVEADSRQLRQVFENLLTNAKEAISDGGRVGIDIENRVIDGNMGVPLGSGNYVCIALQDDGKGIPKENLPKIFDPYFSTKDTYSQKGMGLGLSICHTILKRHSGYILVESEVGIGTRVTVYLPATVEEINLPSEGR